MGQSMDHYSKVEALKRNPMFQGLTQDELDLLAPLLRVVEMQQGDCLFQEGDRGEPFFVVASGEIEISKKDPAGKEIRLTVQRSGDIFGEMASLTDQMRSATAKSIASSSLLEVSLEKLSHIPHVQGIHRHIESQLAHELSVRVKGDSVAVVEAVSMQSDRLNPKRAFGNIASRLIGLIFLFFAFRLYTFVYAGPQESAAFSLAALAVIGFLLFRMMKKSALPMHLFGFAIGNWKIALFQSLVITGAMMAAMLGVKWAYFPDASVSPSVNGSLLAIGYAAFVLFQEFIYRGGLQTVIEQLLTGRQAAWTAVLISNIPFALVHAPWSMPQAAVIYLFGLAWGWMYARQRSLIGCTISHLLIGLWGYFIFTIKV